MFFGLRSDEDPQDLLDVFYNIHDAMGVTSIEKAQVAAYQIIGVSKNWYVQWRDNRELRGG